MTMISMKSRIITAIKRAIMQIPAPSQKASIGFGNFNANPDNSGKKVMLKRILCIYYPV